MAATLATDRIFEGFIGDAERAFYYGHTFCGNPLGGAIALVAIIAPQIRMAHQAAQEAKLKKRMIEAGYSVDDIERRSGLGLSPAFTTPQHDMIEAIPLTPAEWDAMVPTRACVSVR